ncbi:MAG TPA: hypothetical protein ENN99_08295 [Chloroflexi bacterium]|nr:hypothetical protein [Chloroflexota bacterium]
MGNVQTPSVDTVAQRLRRLAQLYQQGQASDLIERTLDKLLSHEAHVCRTQLSQLEADLTEFEQRYDLPSTEFYRRFQAGQTDDRMDYVEWASLVQMRDNLQQRLRLLTGTDEGQVLS